jgi:hypothetical protein
MGIQRKRKKLLAAALVLVIICSEEADAPARLMWGDRHDEEKERIEP